MNKLKISKILFIGSEMLCIGFGSSGFILKIVTNSNLSLYEGIILTIAAILLPVAYIHDLKKGII